MNELAIAMGSLVLGVIGSVAVSRHYFRRSFRKSITPYIQFFSSPLTGIDPNVRRALKVTYQSHVVENLFEIVFLIANTGDKAIRDVIEPLSLTIPSGARLLDATILHVSPEGRSVTIRIDEKRERLEFIAPLLNSDDFFITKLLLDGSPRPSEFGFRITADELPPRLKAEPLPHELLESDDKRQLQWGLLAAGSVVTLIGAAIAKVVVQAWPDLPHWNETPHSLFAWRAVCATWAHVVSGVPALLLLIVGAMMIPASLMGGSFTFPKRRTFVVPQRIRLLRRSHVHAYDFYNDLDAAPEEHTRAGSGSSSKT
jgi:hypothetical protein